MCPFCLGVRRQKTFITEPTKTLETTIKILFVIFAIVAAIATGVVEGSRERSSTAYQFKWVNDDKGWEISDPDSLPQSITSPYGFLHGWVTYGRSHTLVIPHSWFGDKEVRVHFWDNTPKQVQAEIVDEIPEWLETETTTTP
jgi:hypothetical protein